VFGFGLDGLTDGAGDGFLEGIRVGRGVGLVLFDWSLVNFDRLSGVIETTSSSKARLARRLDKETPHRSSVLEEASNKLLESSLAEVANA
jgi:hypothetical protein